MPKSKTVRSHNAIPYNKIAKLYLAGKTYESIAQAIDRFDSKSADATKPLRAILSRMFTQGYENAEGKVVKLKRREGSRAVAKAGVKKVAKVAKAKPGPKPGKSSQKVVILAVKGDVLRLVVNGHEGKMQPVVAIPVLEEALTKLKAIEFDKAVETAAASQTEEAKSAVEGGELQSLDQATVSTTEEAKSAA